MAPAAERMKKYRERLKKDAVKYEDHLKKERERDKKRSKIKKEAKDNDPNLREKLRQQVRDRQQTVIAVDFISKEDIEKEMPFLNGIWEKVIAIPAIRTLHHFSAVDESNILISRTAASEKTKFEVFLPTKPSKTTMNSDSEESENEWQTPLSILKKAKETESTVHESVASTSRLRYSDVYSDSDEESLENVFNPSVAVTDIRPNVYVLCTVQCEGRSASTMYRYVGVCQGLVNEDGEVKIMFLKNVGDTGTIFKPDESDVSYVAICILPTPTLKLKGNRPYYEFSAEVDVFEKG